MLGIVFIISIIAVAIIVRLWLKKAWVAQAITGGGLLAAAGYYGLMLELLLAVPLLLVSVSDLRWARRNYKLKF